MLSNVFKSIGKEARYFYLCVIGGMMQLTSYEEIKRVVKELLILANYPIEGTLDDGSEIPTHKCQVNLQRFIRTHDVSTFIQQEKENDDEEKTSELDWCTADNAGDIQWFHEMLSEVEGVAKSMDYSPSNLSSNTTINHYKCTNFNSYLCELLQRLPLWGRVMNQYYKQTKATSSDIESWFNILKNNVFNNFRLPVSAPVFVKKLINEVSAVAKVYNITVKADDKRKEENDNQNDKKEDQSVYLEDDQEMISVENEVFVKI